MGIWILADSNLTRGLPNPTDHRAGYRNPDG